MSVAEKEFAVDILTLRKVFPVSTKLVLLSIKSNTRPDAVLPSFLIIVLPVKSLAIAVFNFKNTELAPNFRGSLLYEVEMVFATETNGILA